MEWNAWWFHAFLVFSVYSALITPKHITFYMRFSPNSVVTLWGSYGPWICVALRPKSPDQTRPSATSINLPTEHLQRRLWSSDRTALVALAGWRFVTGSYFWPPKRPKENLQKKPFALYRNFASLKNCFANSNRNSPDRANKAESCGCHSSPLSAPDEALGWSRHPRQSESAPTCRNPRKIANLSGLQL